MGKFFTASIKMIYRDKQATFWALAFPIIFAVIFGLFDFEAQPPVKIELTGATQSQAGTAIQGALKEIDSFEVSTATNLETAKADIGDGDLDVVVDVPEMTGPQGTVTVYYSKANMQTNQFALSAINQTLDGMNLVVAGVEPMFTMQPEPVQSKKVTYYDFILPGLVAMGVMNVAIGGIAVGITKFREQKILKRILATPARPGNFLVAQVLARLVLAFIQTALILAVGVYVFGANIYGNVVWLFVLATLANLIFLNIGFAIAGKAKTSDAATGIAQAVALPMMFLSGVFFPIETLPTVLQGAVKLLPLTPLIEAMRKVSIDGLSITACGVQIAALAAWVVVSFVIARLNFSFAEKGA